MFETPETLGNRQNKENCQPISKKCKKNLTDDNTVHSNEENPILEITYPKYITNLYNNQLILIQGKSKTYYTVRNKSFKTKNRMTLKILKKNI